MLLDSNIFFFGVLLFNFLILIYYRFIKMSHHKGKQEPNNLQSIFRSQIVQKYPPQQQYIKPIFIEQELPQQKHMDIMQSIMRDNEIVEQYLDIEIGTKRRSILNYENLMASQSQNNDVPSRNSSLSSKDNNLDFRNRSFDRFPHIIKKFSQDMMDIEEPIQKKKSIVDYQFPVTPMRVASPIRDRQRSQKITKIQQVGCNCRKSKCLKMYCECFHLQIFCSQNCNCVDCGNHEPNAGHQQAVIDALTRNPKAFEQQKVGAENSFTLGVQLAEVKKGCKCKKTKCLKKYCQCYNSGSKCGIFCKCESCSNN